MTRKLGTSRKPFKWNPLSGGSDHQKPHYLPTEKDIAKTTAEIQRQWSTEQRLSRTVGYERESQPQRVYRISKE